MFDINNYLEIIKEVFGEETEEFLRENNGINSKALNQLLEFFETAGYNQEQIKEFLRSDLQIFKEEQQGDTEQSTLTKEIESIIGPQNLRKYREEYWPIVKKEMKAWKKEKEKLWEGYSKKGQSPSLLARMAHIKAEGLYEYYTKLKMPIPQNIIEEKNKWQNLSRQEYINRAETDLKNIEAGGDERRLYWQNLEKQALPHIISALEQKDIGIKRRSESQCPYCNNKLEKAPLKKSKCPVCQKIMFKKSLPYTKEDILVTEEGKIYIEKEYNKIAEVYRQRYRGVMM